MAYFVHINVVPIRLNTYSKTLFRHPQDIFKTVLFHILKIFFPFYYLISKERVKFLSGLKEALAHREGEKQYPSGRHIRGAIVSATA